MDLAQESAGFHRSLPASMLPSLADLVRTMNCYYSNLIEGHATHPVDIELALKGDYSQDAQKRDLQLEAMAHITVQQWIDAGGLDGRVVAEESIREIHRRFCEHLPADLLSVEDPVTRKKAQVIPGALRTRDIKVGQHVAISPGAVPRFLRRFQDVYAALGTADTVIAAAAAHHRLLWIHPFLDGNGRVARLLSHAMLLAPLHTGAVWSIARGLARNVQAYKGHLAACDQVSFMESLLQPELLRARILTWAEEEIRLNHLPPKAGEILQAVLYRGDLPRADVPGIVGAGERHTGRIVFALLDQGVLVSESTRAPLRLAFPAALAPRWMPGLFPERTG